MKKFSKKVIDFLICKNNDEYEFKPILTEIEERPINPLGSFIYWVVICAIFVTALWLYLGKVDVVVTTRGIVIPAGEEKVVKALDKGIIKSINITEGDFVTKGQTLMIIKPAEYEPALELNNLREEAAITMEKLAAAKYQLTLANDEKNRLSTVKDILPKARYDEAVNKVSVLSHEVNSLKASLREITNKENQTEKLVQIIQSPITGYINTIKVHTIGGVVAPTEELLTIVPENAKLQIKATVLNQDIGFVKEGMPASIKIDTYNFQKYGILTGMVTTVSPNSIEDEHLGSVYEVYLKLNTNTLMVEGQEKHVKVGMTTINEIKIGKRRIIEFFIYPLIKYFDESIKVR